MATPPSQLFGEVAPWIESLLRELATPAPTRARAVKPKTIRLSSLLLEYSPDQPRDFHGRFAGGFETYDEAQDWIAMKSKEYGSRDSFLASSEYRTAYPEIQKLHKKALQTFADDGERAMKNVGAAFGDRVFYDYVTPFGVTPYTGTIVKSSKGIPHVKLDAGQTTLSGRASVQWHRGFRRVEQAELVIEYSPDQPRDEDGKWTDGDMQRANVEKQLADFRQGKIADNFSRQNVPISGYNAEKYGSWDQLNKEYFWPHLEDHTNQLRNSPGWKPQKIDWSTWQVKKMTGEWHTLGGKGHVLFQSHVNGLGFNAAEMLLSPEPGNRWAVRLVQVAPAFQMQGVAKRLYREAIKFAKGKGASAITSDPEAQTNPNLWKLWRQLGAKEFPDAVQKEHGHEPRFVLDLKKNEQIEEAEGDEASRVHEADAGGEEDGHWITLDNGVHVMVDNKSGRITKGPPNLIGGRPHLLGKSYTKPLQPGQETEQAYRDMVTGEWEKERQAYHDEVVNEYMKGTKAPVGRAPIAMILGGGTASGKTSLSRELIAENPTAVRIDPDEIKLDIPEYPGLKASDPENAAGIVHEESSHLTKRIAAAAIDKRLDMTYDSTTSGRGGPEMTQKLLSKGYDVRVAFIDIPVNTAIERAVKRAKSSKDPMNLGRNVKVEHIVKNHRGAAENFFTIKDIPGLTNVKFFDNSGKGPVLIFEKNEKGNEQIYDAKRLESYLRKSKGLAERSGPSWRPGPVPDPGRRGRIDENGGRGREKEKGWVRLSELID